MIKLTIGSNTYDVLKLRFDDAADIRTYEFPISEFKATIKTANTITRNQWVSLKQGTMVIAKYWMISAVPDGRGFVEVLAKSALYFFDLVEMGSFFPVEHAAEDLLWYTGSDPTYDTSNCVLNQANIPLDDVTIDSDVIYIGGSEDVEITGLLPQQTARERLQHLLFRLGAYPKTIGIGDNVLAIKRLPGVLDTKTLTEARTYWKPEPVEATYISNVSLKYYTYTTPPTPNKDAYLAEDGNYYSITEMTEYRWNPDETVETPYNPLNVSDIYIITGDEKDDILLRLESLCFYERDLRASILFNLSLDVSVGDRIIVPFFGGDYIGYVKTMTYTFGHKAKADITLTGTQFREAQNE